MNKRTTIDDVAQQAGVSRQTVSRAINGMTGISDATRSRVLGIVRELDYRPSRLAQGMASQRTQTMGLIVGSITHPGHADIMRGLQDVALQFGCNVFLRNTDYGKQAEIEALRSLMAENVDGIVIVNSRMCADDLKAVARPEMPIVVVHRAVTGPNLSSILTDTARTTQVILDYLFGMGHRHVGLLTRLGSLDAIEHANGYKVGYQQRGLSFSAEWIAQGPPTLEGGYAAAQRLLAQAERPTAIFAYNDLMAIGAMRACNEAGCRVPDDISVVGYNDLTIAAYVHPALSTARFNGYEVGSKAMTRLVELRDNPDKTFAPIYLDIELIVRDSTRARPLW